MTESFFRQEIVRIGRLMYEKGYVVANDGNISCRISDGILITPSGVSKGAITPDSLLVVDEVGRVLRGEGTPSSELRMHLMLYRQNSKIQAVCHAHPLYATAFAVSGQPLDIPLTCEAVVNLGEVPVCPFAMPGTCAVPESVAPYAVTHCAVLLQNHGALTWGNTLSQAFDRLESVEFYAKMLHLLGFLRRPPQLITPENVDTLIKKRKNLGFDFTAGPCSDIIKKN